jgi:hypothetical protein
VTASNESPPAQPASPPDGGPTMTCFVTVAVATSQGPGPGPKTLPVAEGQWLMQMKYAVAGDQPPRGWPG